MYLNHVRYGTTDADTVSLKPVGCMVSSWSAETRWWTQLQKKKCYQKKRKSSTSLVLKHSSFLRKQTPKDTGIGRSYSHNKNSISP